MKPIEERLSAALGFDVIHGSDMDREIYSSQVKEGIAELRRLRSAISTLTADRDALRKQITQFRELLVDCEYCINQSSSPSESLLDRIRLELYATEPKGEEANHD